MPVPNKEGFFWGRWHMAAPGTVDDGEACTGAVWEVHSVFWNGGLDEANTFRVMVPGIEKSQALDAFEWGEEVQRPDYAGVR